MVLWHEAVLCECLALLADQTVLSAMLQLVGAAQTASLLAMAWHRADLAALAHKGEYRAATSSTPITDEERQ